MITENEKVYVNKQINFIHNLAEALSEINEKYGCDSLYDPYTQNLYVWIDKVKENFGLTKAKERLKEFIDDGFINIIWEKYVPKENEEIVSESLIDPTE